MHHQSDVETMIAGLTVELRDDLAAPDALDCAKHPVFHAKIAIVLKEYDAIPRRKTALPVIGLECPLAGFLALRQFTPVL